MADYYPLIARAVAGLEKNNGENRRALYERARGALLAQLRSVTPALNESDITRERLALEESIRKVEAESARKFTESTRQPPPPRIRPIEPRPPEEGHDESAQPRRYVPPPAEPSQEARVDGERRPRALLPALSSAREKAKRTAVKHLLETFFNGSPEQIVAALLDVSSTRLTREELDRMSQMIEKAKGEGK